jgi:acyl-CoA thioesterase-2
MVDGVGGEHFIDRLSLSQVDRDIFTGVCHSGAPLRAYGGQIAAQALMAAGQTVDEAGRRVHSLHGYFLRPGRTKDTITYLVERPRDGGSFSTRIVRAVQHGETIFMMTTSFSVVDPGPEHQFQMPRTPLPSQGRDVDIASRAVPPGASAQDYDFPDRALIEMRTLSETDSPLDLDDQGRFERMAWVRITEPMPDDPLVQACALTYLSDLSMVTTATSPHREQRGSLQLASIDHAMWFHADFDTHEWLLFDQDTPVARGGHGLARGLFYDEAGKLVASVVQESLMRTMRNQRDQPSQ